MKKAFLKSINWVLLGLIGILGFAVLGCDPEPDPLVDMYGSPHANYSEKSAVVDIEVNE